MGCCPPCGPSGDTLVVLGAAVSAQIAQGSTTEELELLAAFFDVVGDNLALIAVRRAQCEAACEKNSGTASGE